MFSHENDFRLQISEKNGYGKTGIPGPYKILIPKLITNT